MNGFGRSLSLGLSVSGTITVLASPTLARTIELKLLPTNGPAQNCPTKVIAYETPQPYQEGGYATDGMVQLQAIATNIAITQTSPFSVTWTGTLKPEFRNCEATAGITTLDSEPYSGHSYLRLQLWEGKARAILDMTGMRDANDYTTVILNKTLRNGDPRWTWGGTD